MNKLFYLALLIATDACAETIKPAHPAALIKKHALEKTEKERKSATKSRYNHLAHKTLKGMTEEELREYSNACLTLEYFEECIKSLEQLIAITKNILVAKEARIEIADIYFEKGEWKTAGEKYNEFIKLYPADKYVDYAQYKALVSFFYCLPTHDRDQKTTQEVIDLADELLKKEHPFSQDILQIRSFCYRKLYEHNTDIFNQYMKKGSYAAAEKRLDHIKKNFTVAMVDNLELLTLEAEYKLACALHDTTKKTLLEQKLAYFPQSQALKLASAESKKSYVQFF